MTEDYKLWKLVFSKDGKVVNEWKGYFSRAECERAYRDADLIIPWDRDVTYEYYDA
jgi:hypothetical protein